MQKIDENKPIYEQIPEKRRKQITATVNRIYIVCFVFFLALIPLYSDYGRITASGALTFISLLSPQIALWFRLSKKWNSVNTTVQHMVNFASMVLFLVAFFHVFAQCISKKEWTLAGLYAIGFILGLVTFYNPWREIRENKRTTNS